MPAGIMALLGWHVYAASKQGHIVFDHNPESSWKAFFKKVAAVKSEKGAESFVNPQVIHDGIKFALGVIGALLCILGLRSTMTYTTFDCKMTLTGAANETVSTDANSTSSFWGDAPQCKEEGPLVFIFWLLGSFLTLLATTILSSKPGRKFVLAVTNSISKSIGISYTMHLETLVEKVSYKPTPGIRGEPGELAGMAKTLTTLADLWARLCALFDPQMQHSLRNRGVWKKKDTFSMYY